MCSLSLFDRRFSLTRLTSCCSRKLRRIWGNFRNPKGLNILLFIHAVRSWFTCDFLLARRFDFVVHLCANDHLSTTPSSSIGDAISLLPNKCEWNWKGRWKRRTCRCDYFALSVSLIFLSVNRETAKLIPFESRKD
jgi:hypothetical protein